MVYYIKGLNASFVFRSRTSKVGKGEGRTGKSYPRAGEESQVRLSTIPGLNYNFGQPPPLPPSQQGCHVSRSQELTDQFGGKIFVYHELLVHR
jgi:hypothetical protein